VVRLRRDVLRRSTVGVIATHRAPEGGADNTVLGFDANLWFFQNVAVTGFLSYTDSPGLGGTFRERASTGASSITAPIATASRSST